jgi:hypothetical protein
MIVAKLIRRFLPALLIGLCCGCQLIELYDLYSTNYTPYVLILYTVNGEKKAYSEQDSRGFIKEKYWVNFRKVDEKEHASFEFYACGQEIFILSDEDVFRDGKKYYYENLSVSDCHFIGTGGRHFETGWFSFHVVDQDKECFEVSFDTEWADNETGEITNVTGSLYVYEKYYGKYQTRVYRDYIVPL